MALALRTMTLGAGESLVLVEPEPIVPRYPAVERISDEARALSTRLITGLRLPLLAHELTRSWDEVVHIVVPLPQNYIDDAKTLRRAILPSGAVIETGFESSRADDIQVAGATRAINDAVGRAFSVGATMKF